MRDDSGIGQIERRGESPAFHDFNKLNFRSSGQKTAKARLQGIGRQSLRICAVNTDLARKGRIKALQEKRVQILDDENNTSPVIGVRPCFEAHGRMKNMLNAVNDKWARQIIIQGDDAFDPQQVRPMRDAQHFKKKVAGGQGQGRFVHETKGANRLSVPIHVAQGVNVRMIFNPIMHMSMSAGGARALGGARRRREQSFRIEPSCDIR